jgi:hypothetical protein
MGYGSYVAAAAEISVTDGNKIKIAARQHNAGEVVA